MNIRTPVPGYDDVERETTLQTGRLMYGVIRTDDVLVAGTYVGQIIYYGRRLKKGGIAWGWMPEKAPRNSRLMESHEAIQRLLSMDGPARTASAAREAKAGAR